MNTATFLFISEIKTDVAVFMCQMIKLLILVKFKNLPGIIVKMVSKNHSQYLVLLSTNVFKIGF